MTEVVPKKQKSTHYRTGIIVILILAVFTAIEFTISQIGNWIAVLVIIGLLKAFLVIRDYMHVGKVFTGEEE